MNYKKNPNLENKSIEEIELELERCCGLVLEESYGEKFFVTNEKVETQNHEIAIIEIEEVFELLGFVFSRKPRLQKEIEGEVKKALGKDSIVEIKQINQIKTLIPYKIILDLCPKLRADISILGNNESIIDSAEIKELDRQIESNTYDYFSSSYVQYKQETISVIPSCSSLRNKDLEIQEMEEILFSLKSKYSLFPSKENIEEFEAKKLFIKPNEKPVLQEKECERIFKIALKRGLKAPEVGQFINKRIPIINELIESVCDPKSYIEKYNNPSYIYKENTQKTFFGISSESNEEKVLRHEDNLKISNNLWNIHCDRNLVKDIFSFLKALADHDIRVAYIMDKKLNSSFGPSSALFLAKHINSYVASLFGELDNKIEVELSKISNFYTPSPLKLMQEGKFAKELILNSGVDFAKISAIFAKTYTKNSQIQELCKVGAFDDEYGQKIFEKYCDKKGSLVGLKEKYKVPEFWQQNPDEKSAWREFIKDRVISWEGYFDKNEGKLPNTKVLSEVELVKIFEISSSANIRHC